MVTETFLHELTRLNSDSPVDHTGKTVPGNPTVWTDEKHKLYLNLLEASFVKQLNNSRRSDGWLSQNEIQAPFAFPISASKHRRTTKQFVVRQDRHLKAMQFESDELSLDSTADSEDVINRSWIRLSTSTGMHCFATSSDCLETAFHNGVCPRSTMNLFSELASSSEKHPVHHHNDQSSCGNDTASLEVCGQNFVDQQGIINHDTAREILKTAICDDVTADQVFPFGKVSSADGSNDGKTS